MKTIDTKGQLCPAPLILAKKGIQEAAAGEEIEILTDNETSFHNLKNYLKELKLKPTIRTEGNVHMLTINKTEVISDFPSPESFCANPTSTNFVVAIKSEFMGTGDDEIGHFLMEAFLDSLNESDKLPSAILLYNSGVKIALKETVTARSLQTLENIGIPIYACGKCLEYYKIKDLIAVGMVSNMFAITKHLTEAGHIIYP
ncbi:MAG: sulfurtransferase-like selenium metabolism protein YedF [Paludibacter sp.]|nr:sulfurtransferase-like selenium metabolism protein YedF [Paludibacter sp.]